jgi:tetratricopeptide (TPR) repeat protein
VAKKKPKHHASAAASPERLRSQVERALNEGRTQQALELAKQLHKHDPAPHHVELLRQAYLARARQLRANGYLRDAVTVLEAGLSVCAHEPAWLGQVAEELAASGAAKRALDLLAQLPPSPGHGAILGKVVDAALLQGPAGRSSLLEAHQPAFDLVLRAFAQVEAGQDDAVRETLQGIGLQSPFLEWKLLLRGLQAYYRNEDARAVENWQRLNPDRLPARLAAPLRFVIDPPYRQAQPPAVQAALHKQADRLQGPSAVSSLRAVQAALGNPEQLPQAFRLAEGVLPALRQQAPQLIPRLAACFFWALLSGGEPEDVPRYQRVFGAPPDDPQLARVRALLAERLGEMDRAHTYWQQFEKSIAAHPSAWPGEQFNRARSLVWCRMGQNAAGVLDLDALDDLPPFLRNHPARPRPLHPSAEKCYGRALELAPDLLEPHLQLFRYHRNREEDAQAEKAARRLLERFPDHVETLEALGDLRMRHEDYAEGLSLFQRALRANPLNRRLRSKISSAHLFHARSHAEAGRFDEARAEYQAALTFRDGKDQSSILCKWAACEFKAGQNDRAEELLGQATSESGSRLAAVFSILIEVIRLKLPGKLKTRFDREFKAALEEPPAPAAALSLLDTVSAHRQAGVTYRGQPTHEKKALAYLDRLDPKEFTQEQLRRLGQSLVGLKAQKPLARYMRAAQRRFPDDPRFYYLEAEGYIAQGPKRCPIWRVTPLLVKARLLAEKLPPDDEQKRLLEAIDERREMLGLDGFFGQGGLPTLDEFLDGLVEDEEDDWDEEDDDW